MKKLGLVSLLILSAPAMAKDVTESLNSYSVSSGTSSKIKLYLDKKSGHKVGRSFYGSHLNDMSDFPHPSTFKELNLGMIRVGGNSYDVYNYKNGKAKVKYQDNVLNLRSYEEISAYLKSNGLEGVFQVNLSGYQPVLEGNQYVMKRTFNSKEVAELITYLNGTKKLGIVNFSLGNEFAQWFETHSHVWPTQDSITADEYIQRYIETAIAMRTAQAKINGNPNSIKLWGPEMSASWVDYNTNNFSNDCEYTDIRGQVACNYGGGKFTHFLPYFFSRLTQAEADRSINPKGYKLLDYMAIHYYPNFRTDIDDPNSIIKDASGRQRVADMLEGTRLLHDETYVNSIDRSAFKQFKPNILPRMRDWMKKYYPASKLVINEFALDSDYRTFGYHPVVRPLYLADMIGISVNNDVHFFNNFMLNSGKYSPVPWALVQENTEKTNLFYMYKLFSNNFFGEVVKVEDNMGDMVNSYALVEGDNVNLLIVNKSPSAKTVEIVYDQFIGEKKVSTYTIAGWSSSILNLKKNPSSRDRFKATSFGAKEMGVPLDTAYEKRQ